MGSYRLHSLLWLSLVSLLAFAASCRLEATGSEAAVDPHNGLAYETVFDAIRSSDAVAIDAMLRREPARVNTLSAEGLAPLMMAVQRGNRMVAELLLRYGADPNVRNRLGKTPLHGAVWAGHAEMVELLIAAGADVNARDKRGKTPWVEALDLSRREVAKQIQSHGGKQ